MTIGPALEAALKTNTQGGRLYACTGRVVRPRFFCCITGASVGVAKDPVAVLRVDPTRICTGQSVSANVCRSWAPVPVLAVLDHGYIDWGDGSITTFGPPWPCNAGGGTFSHTYNLDPWVDYQQYTITLGIFDDPVNAYAEDTVTIEVVRCEAEPGMLMYAGCEASGPFKSGDGGLTWVRMGLDNIQVHDLDASYFNPAEVWCATENGLYRTFDTGSSWTRINPNMALPAGAEVVAVICSIYDPHEIYALVYRDGTMETWLYRTTDRGRTWTHTQLGKGCAEVTEVGFGAGKYPQPHGFAWLNYDLYMCTPFAGVASSMYKRDWQTKTWSELAGPTNMHGITYGNGFIWAVSQNNNNLYRFDGVNWVITDSGTPAALYNHVIMLENGTICVSDTTCHVDIYNQFGVFIQQANDPVPVRGCNLGNLYSELLTGDVGGVYRYEGDWTTGDFVLDLYLNPGVISFRSWDYAGKGIVSDDVGHVYCKYLGQPWYQMELPSGVDDTKAVVVSSDPQYLPKLLGIFRMGVDNWYIFEFINNRWTRRGCKIQYTPTAYIGYALYDHGDWLFTTTAVHRMELDTTGVKVHDDGRHHLMSMSADGSYVYVGVLNNYDKPIIQRVDYDLASVDIIYNPGTGSWGGVQADPNISGRVWTFGDFGANVKVLVSDNYGDSWTIRQDDGMKGVGRVVRPVLPSVYNPDDILAILNYSAPASCWHSQNDGIYWTRTNASMLFDCHCATRDFVDDQNTFIGRVDTGPVPPPEVHLSFSPNRGVQFVERSNGFTSRAPVSSIVIVT